MEPVPNYLFNATVNIKGLRTLTAAALLGAVAVGYVIGQRAAQNKKS